MPVLLSLVAEPLTALVDTAFVSELGDGPMAALGVGTTLLSAVFWIFNFLGISTQTVPITGPGGDQDGFSSVRAQAMAPVEKIQPLRPSAAPTKTSR